MLVSDQIAEACKSAIYFGMLNQSLFSCFVLVFEFLSVPFPELILGLEISGLGTSFWKGCVCVCVCVCMHALMSARVHIYTHDSVKLLCQTPEKQSWVRGLELPMPEASPLIGHVWLTGPISPAGMLQINRSGHISPAWSAPHHGLPHCYSSLWAHSKPQGTLPRTLGSQTPWDQRVCHSKA